MIQFHHRSPVFFHPMARHMTPFSCTGSPKVYFFDPTSDEATDRTSKSNPQDQHQLAKKGVSVESSSDTPVIYQNRNVHIQDHGDNFTFSLDLPGIKSPEVKVEIREGVLCVEAERKFGTKGSTKHVQHFLLKEQYVDSEMLQANLVDGVLTITVPKKADSKPFGISVVAEYPPETTDDVKEVRSSIDLPGVKACDVKLELHDGTITLRAERKLGERVSIIDKYFSVDLAKVDPNAFKAFLMDGVLTITGYRKEKPEPKTIPVSIGAIEAKKVDEMVVETVTDER